MRKIWVIEVKFTEGYMSPGSRGWEPTVGIALSKDEAEKVLHEFRQNCPDDLFRVTQYLPTDLCP